MKYSCLLIFLLVCSLFTNSLAQTDSLGIPNQELPSQSLTDYNLLPHPTGVEFQSEIGDGQVEIQINGEPVSLLFKKGKAVYATESSPKGGLLLLQDNSSTYRLFHLSEKKDGQKRLRHIPMWLSIIPPLIAIVLALVFKEVITSLFIGIWAGAFIAGGMRIGSLYYFLISILEVVEKYILKALNDSGHLSIIIFSLLIGGMVALISRNGGMAGVVRAFSKYARSPRSAQFITWLLGVAIFFDDYANTLIVGNTMRSVTDKFKVSREKLAYIVDSTAAPVAAVAFITTWIGAELGYISDGVSQIQAQTGTDIGMTAYAIFISSLKYSFYPVLTLAFILMLIYTKRDFGPMYKAEIRARTTGKVAATQSDTEEKDLEDLSPIEGAPHKWYNAVIPVALVIFMTLFGLIDTGLSASYTEIVDAGININGQSWGAIWAALSELPDVQGSFFMKLGKLIGNADSYVALLWASLSGVIAALLLTLGAKIMKLAESISTLITGFKAMLPAIIILTLAWSLASTTEELYTATYLTSTLQDSVNPYAMPAIIFVLSALISFSTGSSWSTMAILYPIAIPTTWAICTTQGLDADISLELLLNVIAVTLAASVLGDHCSPISDTTILSSLASDCNHIDHVRTQLPYAIVVGSVSLVMGTLSTILGGGWLISSILLLIGLALLFGLVLRLGKKIE
ncbi:MAG: Na+/H+ antiporter NhaC family protein [Chitinophagales bacterium]|nr:Na+/H+ antiporter NhaC family protein [Chitinophagales bacterium]